MVLVIVNRQRIRVVMVSRFDVFNVISLSHFCGIVWQI